MHNWPGTPPPSHDHPNTTENITFARTSCVVGKNVWTYKNLPSPHKSGQTDNYTDKLMETQTYLAPVSLGALLYDGTLHCRIPTFVWIVLSDPVTVKTADPSDPCQQTKQHNTADSCASYQQIGEYWPIGASHNWNVRVALVAARVRITPALGMADMYLGHGSFLSLTVIGHATDNKLNISQHSYCIRFSYHHRTERQSESLNLENTFLRKKCFIWDFLLTWFAFKWLK